MKYFLKNEIYKIEVNSLGAELTSFLFNNEEYLYQADTKYWHRSSPLLFPIVGRLKNNNYKYKNKNYRLPIHGFARFNEFELINKTNTNLAFKLTENEKTLKYYPFSFELILSYTLDTNGLKIEYQVSSKENILFSLGAHPAFLLKEDINKSFIHFNKNESLEPIALNLKYGCIDNKEKISTDGNTLELHSNIFEKDALIFKNLNSKEVSLKNKINTKSVNVYFEGFEYLAFWAPIGAPFVCIEPWCGIADNINTNHHLEDKTSIISLKKDEIFNKSLFISLN